MLGVGRSGACGRSEPPPAGAMVTGTPAQVAAGGDLDARERDAWVVLDGVHGVGPVSFARLIGAFGDAQAVLRVATARRGPSRLVAASAGPDGGSPSLSIAIARSVSDAARAPERYLDPLRASGVRALTLADGDYPGRLRRIELPPPVLYVAGSAEALDRAHAVAVVGTRRPTAVGRATSGRIADAIAGLGATVVSGLALGIDAAAHQAALRAGGITVAVIGGGHGRLYPAGHRGLARAIVRARRRGHQRVPARDDAQPRHVPAPEPDHQRARRCDRGGRGRRAKRRAHDGRVGARAGPRAPHRPRSARRSGRRRLPRLPPRGGT